MGCSAQIGANMEKAEWIQRGPDRGLNGARREDPTNRDQSEADQGLDRARLVDPTKRDQREPPFDRRDLIGSKRYVVKESRVVGTGSNNLFVISLYHNTSLVINNRILICIYIL